MTRQDRQPKYLRIFDDLAARIAAGEWAAGSALPPQRELADGYQVTLMTLRQALQLLEAEGLVETRHGTGTFVSRARYHYELGHLRSFAEDLAGQGATVQTRLLGSDEVGESLRIRRLRLVDGRPSVVQSSLLPLALGRRIRPAEVEAKALYAIVAELGVEISHATETIVPTVLDEADALLLERSAGLPALLSRRVSFSADEIAVIEDVAVLPGDTFALHTGRRRGAVDLSYVLAAG